MKRAAPYALALLLLLTGLGMTYHPVFTSGFTRLPVDEGDSRFNHYLLEHAALWLDGAPLHRDLWSPPIFHPARHALAYSDAMVGNAWWYWPFRAAGHDRHTAYAWWMITASAMNFLAMALLLHRMAGIPAMAASAGAFLFAFAVPRTAQLGHQQLLPQMYILMIAAGLMLWIRRPRVRTEAAAGALVVTGATAQLYSGFYHLWFAVFGIAALAVVALCFRETRSDVLALARRPAVYASVLLLLAASWPMLRLYLDALHEVGPRQMDAVLTMLPRLQSWLYTGDTHGLYGSLNRHLAWFTRLPAAHEHVLGIGPFTSMMVLLGAWRWRSSPWGRAVLAATVLVMALTLHYSDAWNPWELVMAVFPGADAVRAVTRVGLLLLIPASFALAAQIAAIRRPWLAALCMTLVVVEQGMRVGTYHVPTVQGRVDALAAALSGGEGPFYYVHDAATSGRRLGSEYIGQLDAMWAGMQAGRPTVNGYSGNCPDGWFKLYFNSAWKERDQVRIRRELDGWLNRRGLDAASVQIVTDPPAAPR